MDASIVILTKNAGENFARLLPCLLSQRFQGEYDVLVIDSGSSDDTLEIARRHSIKTVQIPPEGFHHGRTRNLGAELTEGRFIVYITQDALPLDEQWLTRLTEPLADSSVAMVAGRQIAWERTKPPEKFFYMYSFPERLIKVCLGEDAYRDSIFISDVNSAVRRDVWAKFRFSENILQAEDKEFAKRVVAAGWTIIYEPQAAVYHAHDFTIGSLLRRSRDAGTSLAQGVGMPRSKHWVRNKVGYYFSEAGYIMRGVRWYKWLPYSFAYEGARLFGVAAGWMRQTTIAKRQPKTRFQ